MASRATTTSRRSIRASRDVVDQKMTRDITPFGETAGELTAEAAGWTGLLPGTAGRRRQR